MRIGLAIMMTAAGVLSAADRKIVINALDDHNNWAFTEEALHAYRDAGKDAAAIVLSRSREGMDREIVDADGVIGGLSKDQFAKHLFHR